MSKPLEPEPRPTVLVVTPNPEQVKRQRAERPTWFVVAAPTPEAALVILRTVVVHALVVDPMFDDASAASVGAEAHLPVRRPRARAAAGGSPG